MKTWVGAAACVAVLVLAGCSTSEDVDSTRSAATSSEESYSIDTWQNWGRAGVEWVGKCGDYDWGCIDDQAKALDVSATTLPQAGAEVAARVTTPYRDTYRKYVAEDCGTSTMCSVYEQQLTTQRTMLIDALERFQAGEVS